MRVIAFSNLLVMNLCLVNCFESVSCVHWGTCSTTGVCSISACQCVYLGISIFLIVCVPLFCNYFPFKCSFVLVLMSSCLPCAVYSDKWCDYLYLSLSILLHLWKKACFCWCFFRVVSWVLWCWGLFLDALIDCPVWVFPLLVVFGQPTTSSTALLSYLHDTVSTDYPYPCSGDDFDGLCCL